MTSNEDENIFQLKFNENEFILAEKMKVMKMERYEPDNNNYFNIIPKYQGNFPLDQVIKMNGNCFENIREESSVFKIELDNV